MYVEIVYTKYDRCTRDRVMQVPEIVRDHFAYKGFHDRASVHRSKRLVKERKPAFSSI